MCGNTTKAYTAAHHSAWNFQSLLETLKPTRHLATLHRQNYLGRPHCLLPHGLISATLPQTMTTRTLP